MINDPERYRISDEAHYVYSGIYDRDVQLRNDAVVDLLNELSDENEQIKWSFRLSMMIAFIGGLIIGMIGALS